MHEVWEPFDDQAVPRFYHDDVAGHHRAQKICLDDIAARLRWDRLNFKDPVYDIRDIIADEDTGVPGNLGLDSLHSLQMLMQENRDQMVFAAFKP